MRWLLLLLWPALALAENRAVLFDYPKAGNSNVVFRIYWSTNAVNATNANLFRQDWIILTNFLASKNVVFDNRGIATYRVVFNLTVPGTNYLFGTASDAIIESDPSAVAAIFVIPPAPTPLKPPPPMNFRKEGGTLLKRLPMFAAM